jgi:hypothetical protein
MNCPERGFIRIGQDGGEGTVIIYGDVDVDDWEQVSRAEAELRRHAYDTTDFMRRHAPGFENAWVLFTAPFISARGGPCIRGEHVVTPHDIVTGARFPDVLMRAMWEAVARKVHQNSKATPLTVGGYDVPYRMMLPQGLDGLLVVGRGSAYIRRGHDPGTRGRILQFHLGEAAGVAAALAAADGVTPRSLDTRRLQRELLRRGFWLGEPERLRELGLAE